jgi:uncharacterized lipoprotein
MAAAAFAVVGLAACGSDSASSTSSGDLCSYAKEMEATLGDGAFSTPDKATFDQIEEIVTNVQDKAPDEIKADVATVVKSFADVKAIFAKYDFDLAKLSAAAAADPELTQQLQNFGNEEFTAASDRVSAFLDKECGIKSGS